jgi:hypothetical protein
VDSAKKLSPESMTVTPTKVIVVKHIVKQLGHPHAVALLFAHCDQLAAGLAPAGMRPCWAHHEKKPPQGGFFSWL